MVVFLIIIGALFFIMGKVSGLIAVLWGSRFQFYLCRKHEEIFNRLAVSSMDSANPESRSISSASLWRYIKSAEDDDVSEIFQYKRKIKRYFIMFAVFSMIGISSFLAAVVVLIVF